CSLDEVFSSLQFPAASSAPAYTFLSTFRLMSCSLSEISCKALATALKNNPSNLTELDLSVNNNLQDSGVLHLCGFLESPDCRLQTLRSGSMFQLSVITTPEHTFLSDFRLECCSLSKISCEVLGLVLKNNPSRLTELDLSGNNIQDSGFLHLCGFLESPDCRLQTLRSDSMFLFCSDQYDDKVVLTLNCRHEADVLLLHADHLHAEGCFLLLSFSPFTISCDALVTALNLNPSHLTELDLRNNNLQSSDVQQLHDLVKSPNSKLKTLRSVEGWSQSSCFQICSFSVKLEYCRLSEISCEALLSSLKKNPFNLTELDLSRNKNLQDAGVVHLCGFLESPGCRLQTLRLSNYPQCIPLFSVFKVLKNKSSLEMINLYFIHYCSSAEEEKIWS
uniref:NACHT LRR and PYD domain-containing protein n=1 Tax=Oryzias melastigma TaxID=30732 RepID=A0A3B3DG16_ORYME